LQVANETPNHPPTNLASLWRLVGW